jgi:NADH-quinone oxidoreductase subunit J
MSLSELVFHGIGILTVVSGFYAVYTENLVHAVFALLATFFGMAGLFVYLRADFLAALQVLVYVGGILVLFLFGVMFTQDIYRLKISAKPINRVWGMILGVGFLASFFWAVILKGRFVLDTGVGMTLGQGVEALGGLLLTRYVLAFEAVTLLIVACMVGAILLTLKRE